jgi:hypothetical protein
LDSVTTVRRLVAFYVQEHNTVLPHSAFHGQTPDEMYFGKGDAVPADLTTRATAARQARIEANRSASLQQTSTYLNATLRGRHESMRNLDESRPACKPLANKPARGFRPVRKQAPAPDGKPLIH